MQTSLSAFSDFVSEMHARVRTDDAQGLARWAVDELSHTLGFDAAWYGWARISAEGVEIHANASLDLPDNYYNTWQTMADEDVLAAQILEKPERVATYKRTGDRQTDGMVYLTDSFGLREIATAMHTRPGRVASFYLSSYRLGRHARVWSQEEQIFLQCAVDQLSSAMRLSTSEPGRESNRGAVSIFVNESGIGILGLANLRSQMGDLWPEWDGDHLPKRLRDLLGLPGEHILVDRGLVVRCEHLPGIDGMGLRKLTLRRLTALDTLTHREREVGRLLADGHSHKVAARMLGISPNTVRNQTQAIYHKTGVGSRAELASLFSESMSVPARQLADR